MNNVISNPGAFAAGDPVGHGTHVAGIVAGNSAFRTDGLAGKYAGIAPEADIVAIKTADEAGNSTVLDVINALQFVVDRKDELNIRVVNLSVSSDTPGSYLIDPLDAAVEFAWHAGIVVVAAAGNRGDAADAVQYAPGNDPYVISVGATDETATPRHRRRHARDLLEPRRHAGRLRQAGRSSRRAPRSSPRSPPARAFAPLAPATSIFENGQYIRIGGTSMASPVVAGAAALVLQARPDLNPDQVKALLTQTVNRDRRRRRTASTSRPRSPRSPAQANAGPEPEPDRQVGAAAGRHRPDPRHLDPRDVDARHLDPRHLDRGRSGPAPPGRATPPASTPRGRAPPGPARPASAPTARPWTRPGPPGAAPPGAAVHLVPQHVVEHRMVTSDERATWGGK